MSDTKWNVYYWPEDNDIDLAVSTNNPVDRFLSGNSIEDVAKRAMRNYLKEDVYSGEDENGIEMCLLIVNVNTGQKYKARANGDIEISVSFDVYNLECEVIPDVQKDLAGEHPDQIQLEEYIETRIK